jgi:hypothetical protein
VEYFSREHALRAVAFLSGTKLDGRVVRVELDAGFQPGRQYGRGALGGQVRDDRRGGSSSGTDRKRSRPSSFATRPEPKVSMNDALPSARGTAEDRASDYYGPSGGAGGEEEGEPPHKRRRMD